MQLNLFPISPFKKVLKFIRKHSKYVCSVSSEIYNKRHLSQVLIMIIDEATLDILYFNIEISTALLKFISIHYTRANIKAGSVIETNQSILTNDIVRNLENLNV